MIWVLGLFLALLLLFLLGPVWFVSKDSPTSKAATELDEYAAENLRLYQERSAELAASDFDEDYKQSLQLELDREFLASEQASQVVSTQKIDIKRRLMVPAVMLLFVAFGTLSLYQFWGAADEMNAASLLQASARGAELSQADEKKLLDALAVAAAANPKKIEWGYYYGRVAMEAGQYSKAASIFQDLLKALPLDNEADRVEILNMLVQAKFFDGNQKPSPELYDLIKQSLRIEPRQTQFQGLAGMMAFELGHYQDAINHWRVLWEALPDDPNVQILEQGIARAAERLKEQGEDADLSFLKRTKLTVQVDISPQLKAKYPANTTVFVAAVAVSGPPMPLAAQRLTLGQLPASVVLSDAQAVAPGMNLSAFPEVTLKATLSVSGQPSAQSGDWQGELTPVSNTHEGVLTLLINQQIR